MKSATALHSGMLGGAAGGRPSAPARAARRHRVPPAPQRAASSLPGGTRCRGAGRLQTAGQAGFRAVRAGYLDDLVVKTQQQEGGGPVADEDAVLLLACHVQQQRAADGGKGGPQENV